MGKFGAAEIREIRANQRRLLKWCGASLIFYLLLTIYDWKTGESYGGQ